MNASFASRSERETLLRVFEDGVLRDLIGHNREDVARGSRKLLTEEFHILRCAPNVVRIIKSKRSRLTRLVPLDIKEKYSQFLLESCKERNYVRGQMGRLNETSLEEIG
jgi:hypothetical protein